MKNTDTLDDPRKEIEKLVFAMVNDGKLNGIMTPQKPWVDQILAIVASQLRSLDKEIVSSLGKFTAKHDQPMRDEAIILVHSIIDKKIGELR
jgi:hypothetical protein